MARPFLATRTSMNQPQAPQRILIMRLGAIGDCLRVLPAAARLRQAFPDARIEWAVEHWVLPALAGNPLIDEFHVLDRRQLRGGLVAAMREIWRFSRVLKARRFDVLIDFHGRFKSGLVSALSGVPRRIGFARGDDSEGNFLFTNEHVRLADRWENRVLRFLHLLQPLGVSTDFDAARLGLQVDATLRSEAQRWHLAVGRPALAVYPGCSQARMSERWPQEKWVELLQRLHADGVASIIFWGPAEKDFAADIARQAEAGCSLAPATSLAQMQAMLGCFSAYLGSDTAAMHMAWMQQVPVAVFMGPKPLRTASPMPPVAYRCLRSEALYRPELATGKQSDELVRAVPVDAVHTAVRELLAGITNGTGK